MKFNTAFIVFFSSSLALVTAQDARAAVYINIPQPAACNIKMSNYAESYNKMPISTETYSKKITFTLNSGFNGANRHKELRAEIYCLGGSKPVSFNSNLGSGLLIKFPVSSKSMVESLPSRYGDLISALDDINYSFDY